MTKSAADKPDFDGPETWPEITRDALELAVRTAANLHGLPPACRMKTCRKTGRCQTEILRDPQSLCQGDWTHAADLTVVGMFAFLLHLTRHWWED